MSNPVVGMSAAERDVRVQLDAVESYPDDQSLYVRIGVLRTLMRDMDLWREIVGNEIDKWSFDALVHMAKRILDEVYPADIFDGSSGDSGPQLVAALRAAIERIERDDACGEKNETPATDHER